MGGGCMRQEIQNKHGGLYILSRNQCSKKYGVSCCIMNRNPCKNNSYENSKNNRNFAYSYVSLETSPV